MKPGDFIAIAIIVVIIGLAVRFIIKQKKKGVKCIGCSACSCNCPKNNTNKTE